jgi:hypothetical protein
MILNQRRLEINPGKDELIKVSYANGVHQVFEMHEGDKLVLTNIHKYQVERNYARNTNRR